MAYPVRAYIYDISGGLAAQLSEAILGKRLEGIWHTGVVVYGKEYFFGSMGIESCSPGGTILGQPHRVEELGDTEIPEEVFNQYLIGLKDSFSPDQYHLLDHNCNNFTAEVCLFLTGKSIPEYITNLPSEFMSTPLGAMLRPMLDSMSVRPTEGQNVDTRSVPFYTASSTTTQSSHTVEPLETETKSKETESKEAKQDEEFAPIKRQIYWSKEEILAALKSVKDAGGQLKLSEDEKELIEKLELHGLGNEAQPFLHSVVTLIGRLLQMATSKSADRTENRLAALAAFQLLTVTVQWREGFYHYSQQTDHLVFRLYRSYLKVKDWTIDEAIRQLMINLCYVDGGLYVTSSTPWTVSRTVTTSNLQETVTLIVNSLIAEDTHCQLVGSQLLLNISWNKLADGCDIQCASAAGECLRSTRDRQTCHNLFESLVNLVNHNQEVLDLLKILEIDVEWFGAEDMWSSRTEKETFKKFLSLLG